MKKRSPGSKGQKVPMDGAPLNPSGPELIVTKNPWKGWQDDKYENKEIDLSADELPSLQRISFIEGQTNYWFNQADYRVVWGDGRNGEPVVARLAAWRTVCTLGNCRLAAKKKAVKGKKLTIKG